MRHHQILPRSIRTLLTTLFLGACSSGGMPDPNTDQMEEACPTPPKKISPFQGMITVICQGTSKVNGPGSLVYSPTRAEPMGDGQEWSVSWVPVCLEKEGAYQCPAPPESWNKEFAMGMDCFVTPCQRIDPKKVTWYDAASGEIKTPARSPNALPMPMERKKELNEPKGGGDSCLADPYGWQFRPTM
jgi:hypothetical protein